MTRVIVCDDCGEPIDESQPYYELNGTLVQTDETGALVVVEAAKVMHYHQDHIGQGVLEPAIEVEPEPEPPTEELPPTEDPVAKPPKP